MNSFQFPANIAFLHAWTLPRHQRTVQRKKKLRKTVKKADEWKKEGGQMTKREDWKRQEASIILKVQMCQMKQIRKEEGKKENFCFIQFPWCYSLVARGVR